MRNGARVTGSTSCHHLIHTEALEEGTRKAMKLGNVARLARNHLYGVRPLKVPEYLTARYAEFTQQERFSKSLLENFFNNKELFPESDYLSTPAGKYDFSDHLFGRLGRARLEVVSWIASHTILEGKKILEVGCGTGSSTVAFAEQGATVVAQDVDEGSLQVARDRLASFGLTAELKLANGLPDGHCDIVLLFAVLEHMTLEERLSTIRESWARLPSGGLLVAAETPNRLWYYDSHTSNSNFYNWLPDDLALLYARRTSRLGFRHVSTPLALARWGRGVSFHDFEVALDMEADQIPILSSLTHWIRTQTNTARLDSHSSARSWESNLKRISPKVHEGFSVEYLDLILQKP